MRANQKLLSEIFGVSTKTIQNWVASGCPFIAVGKSKEYETEDVHQWRVDKAIAEYSPTFADDDEVKQATKIQVIAKAKTASALAERAYIDLAKQKGDVVPREKVEEIVSDVLSEVIQALDVIPIRYCQQLLDCSTESEIKEKLKNAVFEARSNISKIKIKINIANEEALKEELEKLSEDVQE